MAQPSVDTNNQQSAGGGSLSAFLNPQSSTAPVTPAGSRLSSFLADPVPAAPAGAHQTITEAQLDQIASAEGLSDVQRRTLGAIIGQESGGNAAVGNSVNGAVGGGQVMPDTFRQFALAGERIDNPVDNLKVAARIVRDLGQRSGDDPARIATGYFSGAGNIAKGGQQAWLKDAADGNGKKVSSYVGDVLARLTGSAPAQAAEQPVTADLGAAPKWSAIVKKQQYLDMSDEDRAAARDAYFQRFVAPAVPQDQADAYRKRFDEKAAQLEPQRGTSVARRVGDLAISGMKGVIGVPEAVVGLLDIPTGGAAGKLAEAAGVRFKDAKSDLDYLYSDAQKAANKRVADARGFVDTGTAMLSNPSTIAQTITESAPSMLAGGAVGRGVLAAAPALGAVGAAAAGEGIIGAGQAAEQIRQSTANGRLTAGQAAAAVASGVGTAAFGVAGGRLAKRLGIADVDTYLVQQGVQGGTKGVARRLLEGGISEGLFEELPQSAQEQVWQNAALGKPLLEGVPEAAAQGLITGAAMGGGASTLLHGRGNQETTDAPPAPPAADERIEPTLGEPSTEEAAPAPAADEAPAAADQQDVPSTEPTEIDQDVLDYAASRYRQLRTKRDGVLADDGTEVDGAGLSPSEQEELAGLEANRGNPRALAQQYGFDPEAPDATPITEHRDQAAADYKAAALAGDEAGAQAAMNRLTETREALVSVQERGAQLAQQQVDESAEKVAAAEAEKEAAAAAEKEKAKPAPAAKPKTEKEARARRAATKPKESSNAPASPAIDDGKRSDRAAVADVGADGRRPGADGPDAGRGPGTATAAGREGAADLPADGGAANAQPALTATPAQQELLAEALKKKIITPGSIRADRFRAGLLDATSGRAPQQQDRSYVEGHTWATKKAAKAAPVAAAPAPAAPKKKPTEKQARAERAAQLADYLAPGNVVKGYGGYDRIISSTIGEDGAVTVRAQAVVRDGDSWVPAPGVAGRERTHTTVPGKSELKAGPVARGDAQPAPAAKPKNTLADQRQAKVEYPAAMGDSKAAKAQNKAQRAVVDFMNGEINKPKLIDELASLDLYPAQIAAATYRLGDDFLSDDRRKVHELQQKRGMILPDLNDIDLSRDGPAARQPAKARIDGLARLKKLAKRHYSGFLTDAEYAAAVRELTNRMAEQSASRTEARYEKSVRPRERGELWIRERLLRAQRTGELSAEQVGLATWALDQNPALANDLGISMREGKGDGIAGSYIPGSRIIQLVKGSGNAETVLHEIMHHTERMMPADVQRGIVREWSRAFGRAWKAGDEKVRAAMGDMLASSMGDRAAHDRMIQAFRDGVLRYDDHYHLVNASEYWAVNASELLAARADGARSWIKAAKQWLSELVEQLRGQLRLPSDAPVLAGLREIMRGNGERLSNSMLVELSNGQARSVAENLNNIETLADVSAAWDATGIKNFMSERKGVITLGQIVVPETMRSGGKGTAAMQKLIDYADRTGQRIALSPSGDFGGNKARLVEFYKRLGFVENKGRNKDSDIRETMYRDPIALEDITRPRTAAQKAQQQLVEEFGKPSFGTIDWWDKSVGTQYHKAAKNPKFKKVFDLAVARENAISLTALRPSDVAPAFLPRINDFRGAARTLLAGRKTGKQTELAGRALLDGTLEGDNVMEGRVWTEAELRARGLDDQGVTMYRQAREAIDASLDEIAAAEAYGVVASFVPKTLRDQVLNDPRSAQQLLSAALETRLKLEQKAVDGLRGRGAKPEAQDAAKERLRQSLEVRDTMGDIFETSAKLKQAGYTPLMRFGSYFVQVEQVDPETGKTVIDPDTGKPATLFFGRYETEAEAQDAYFQQQVAHRGRAEVSVRTGTVNDQAHKLYQGISPETVELFGQLVGAGQATEAFYQQALSERSALKRRLTRSATDGYSRNMPRVLANFITSNARFASQRYYNRDINQAIKYIPRIEGDVQKEAIKLKEYIDNPGNAGAIWSSLAFTWFLGGNVASAIVNATQPIMMTAPYFRQFTTGTKAYAALVRAAPQAAGRREITDPELRAALKRGSQEGKVDAQEVFHLYSIGIQSVASTLAGKLSKLPVVGNKVKGAQESASARLNALGTLWGMPFAVVEGFNRRLTFIAAWDIAKQRGIADPYRFAVDAIDQTQGIYNKVNRPNWARSSIGRVLFTFAQFKIMNVEILKRMATMGGPEGKKAAAMYLATLILAAGAGGVPYADDIDDLIDTVGQWLGYNTNMKRKKREWAYETLGKGFGDLALYGVSAHLPFDIGGRVGLGNILPSTGLAKPSNADSRGKELLEVAGPALGGLGGQFGDAFADFSVGDTGKAIAGLMPTGVKNAAAGIDMAVTGKAKDRAGKLKTDVDGVDALSKGIGFNPTKIAEKNRQNMPIMQDLALQRIKEASILDQWAQGIAQNDQDSVKKAQERMKDWNTKNPETPVAISAAQLRSKVKSLMVPADTRLMKRAPREMKAQVAAGLERLD